MESQKNLTLMAWGVVAEVVVVVGSGAEEKPWLERESRDSQGRRLGVVWEIFWKWFRRRKILFLNLLIGAFSLKKLWMDIWVVYVGPSEMGRVLVERTAVGK